MSEFQLDAQQQSNNIDTSYQEALERIKQLENELQQKDQVLDINLKEQITLRERLQACVNTIQETTSQLGSVESDLKKYYRQILQQTEELQQEVRTLELSNGAWSNRSIKLEFDVLTAQQAIKTIKADHDSAMNKIALLEMELKAIKTENSQLRQDKENNA